MQIVPVSNIKLIQRLLLYLRQKDTPRCFCKVENFKTWIYISTIVATAI